MSLIHSTLLQRLAKVDLVGLSEVDGEEMFEFELVLPDDAVVRRQDMMHLSIL